MTRKVSLNKASKVPIQKTRSSRQVLKRHTQRIKNRKSKSYLKA